MQKIWRDRNNKELKDKYLYRISEDSLNEFKMIKEFNPNKKCFQRIHDMSLHYGREFIEYKNKEPYIDLYRIGEGNE